MDIQCEKCRTVFSIDETLIKEGGSKVRCSICRHVFTAYTPVPALDAAEIEIPIEPAKGRPDEEIADELVPTIDEDRESEVKEKNEGLGSDIDRIPEDAFQKPAGELAGKIRDVSENDQGLMEDGIVGGEERSVYDPAADFLAVDSMDDRSEEYERAAESMNKILSKKKSSKWAYIMVFVVILLALCGAVVAINYWKPELMPPTVRSFLEDSVSSFLKAPEKEEPVDPGVRLLEFSSMAGSFVDSEKGGRLFVIRGVVSNKYPKPRSYILIKGNILDNKGEVVKSEQSYAGNTFTEEEIKALPLEEIKKAMNNRDGMARKNFNLSSGESIPFMIIFDNLPDNLSEFTVEAVSSSPGT